MSHVVAGHLGGRKQTTSRIITAVVPGVPSTYDELVDSLEPGVVSYWKFKEPSGATVADEYGVQNATITGTPERSVPTIVDLDTAAEGAAVDGVVIAWPGIGSDHALVSHNAAHKTAAGTQIITFQCDTLNETVMLADADNTLAGSLEMSVNANGSIRGFVRDAANLPRVLTGNAGDIQIGIAYTMILKWGSAGLSLSLWNADDQFIRRVEDPTMTAGLVGNTANMRLGSYQTNAAAFDGPFGRVIRMDRRITNEEEGIIARAKTITHGTPPPLPQAEPLVPRTDVWLTNDDMAIPGTGTVRYARPTGSGVGGTTEAAAGNIHSTLTASAAGDTVVCLQGYYDAPNGLTIPAGASAASPVTVMAKPGEWAVVCQDIDLMKLPNIPAGAGRPAEVQWTLHDAAHNVWRIPYTASTGAVVGCWFEGGIAHLLLPYDEPAHMLASEGGDKAGDTRDSVNRTNTRFVYWGPGVGVGNSTGGDGTTHLFIRFDRPNWTDVGFVDGTLGAWPDDNRWTLGVEGQTTPRKWFSRSNSGDFKTGRPCMPNPLNETPNSNGDFPSGQAVARNPNSARIYVARTFDRSVINASSGGFIRIGSGMNTHGFKRFSSAKSNIEVHRGCDWLPFSGVEGSCSNITFHRRRQFQGVWRWLASMAAYKFNDFLSPPNQAWEFSANTHSVFLNGNTGSLNNITWDNCSLYGYHELILGTNACERIRFVNCCIGWLYDEFMQVFPHRFSRFEVGHCYFRDSSFGMGTDISNGSQVPHGSVFWHHNIIDSRCGRASFGGNRPINGGPPCVGRAHTGSTAHKMYNNTWIQSPDGPSAHGLAMGNQLNHRATSGGASRLEYDEVFNNIIVRYDTKRYATNEGGQSNRDDSVEHGVLTLATHNAYRDYNCYSRHGLPMVGASYDRAKYYELNDHYDTNVGNFSYIRAQPSGEPAGSVFFGSSQYNSTKTMQSLAHPQGRGFDDNGTDANPQIPSQTNFPTSRMNYRPQATSVVSASATPPSETNWWSSPGWTSYGATPVPFNLAPSAWKGALAPNGSTMPVGVQNP